VRPPGRRTGAFFGVDLGMAHPARRLGAEFAYLYARPKRDPALAALAQVQALGFAPTDVRHVVLTHLDLDHVGGLSDFPHATVHLHAAELVAARARRTFKDRRRYRPLMWAHQPHFQTYADEGEPWFGFEAVRGLAGLPPELLLVPLFGHTLSHCGVAVDATDGWLLHAGDAYFDPREVHGERRRCAVLVGLFQAVVQTNRRMRVWNQGRLRALTRAHPEVTVFSAHNPFELPPPARRAPA